MGEITRIWTSRDWTIYEAVNADPDKLVDMLMAGVLGSDRFVGSDCPHERNKAAQYAEQRDIARLEILRRLKEATKRADAPSQDVAPVLRGGPEPGEAVRGPGG